MWAMAVWELQHSPVGWKTMLGVKWGNMLSYVAQRGLLLLLANCCHRRVPLSHLFAKQIGSRARGDNTEMSMSMSMS